MPSPPNGMKCSQKVTKYTVVSGKIGVSNRGIGKFSIFTCVWILNMSVDIKH